MDLITNGPNGGLLPWDDTFGSISREEALKMTNYNCYRIRINSTPCQLMEDQLEQVRCEESVGTISQTIHS